MTYIYSVQGTLGVTTCFPPFSVRIKEAVHRLESGGDTFDLEVAGPIFAVEMTFNESCLSLITLIDTTPYLE